MQHTIICRFQILYIKKFRFINAKIYNFVIEKSVSLQIIFFEARYMRQKSVKLQNTVVNFKDAVIAALQDKKAQDIVELDLSEIKMSLFERFIICTATSNTHAEALYDNVLRTIKQNLNILPKNTEGIINSQWILIDYFDILVHIFLKENREFYNIESLWVDAKRMEYNFTI